MPEPHQIDASEMRALPPLDSMTHLKTYDEVLEAFVSPDMCQGGHKAKSWPLSKDTLLTLDGEQHFDRRRLESTLFRKKARARYDLVLGSALDRRLSNLESQSGVIVTDLPVLVRSALLHVAASVIGLMGQDDIESMDRLRLLSEPLATGNNLDWMDDVDPNLVMAEALEAQVRFGKEYFWPAYHEYVRTKDDQNGSGDDFHLIRLLAEDRETPAGRELWTDDSCLRETVLYLTAVTTSQSRAICHVVDHLDKWFVDHPQDRDLVADFDFLRSATIETLRLHPRGPVQIRRAEGESQLKSGREIADGSYLILDTFAAGQDGSVFGPDADQWNPHRVVGGMRPYGVVFGGGPHTCIGLGLSIGAASFDGSDGTPGTLVRLLHDLYQRDIQPDRSDQPDTRETGVGDVNYRSYPVRLKVGDIGTTHG